MPGERDHGTDVLPLAQGIWRAEAGPGASAEGVGEGELTSEAAGGRAEPGQADPERYRGGKLISPARRRMAVSGAQEKYQVSERRVCLLVKQPRGTQRYRRTQREDEDALTRAILALAHEYGRYGYRRVTAMLQHAGWHV